MAAHEIDQLLAAIRGLAPAKRRELLERVAEELPDEALDPFAFIGSFADEPELVWIRGAHVQMVDRNDAQPMPELFMCHANLDIDKDAHQKLLGGREFPDGRVFTLSQGQLEVEFPAGDSTGTAVVRAPRTMTQ